MTFVEAVALYIAWLMLGIPIGAVAAEDEPKTWFGKALLAFVLLPWLILLFPLALVVRLIPHQS